MTPAVQRKLTPGGPTRRAFFFIAPGERARIAGLAKRFFPESIGRTVAAADDICRHVFDLLGSGKTELGGQIDWHRDFKSGLSWDPRRRWGVGDDYLRPDDHSDVKVPWDLSSFLHLPTLGRAYWCTGEEKYAREFAGEIRSWIEDNPPGRGINWACTMKVAHRLLNWIWGCRFFREADGIDPGFWENFFSSLEVHGRYVIGHLEARRPANNHYLLGLAALFYFGSAFPGLRRSLKYLRFSRRGLEAEMQNQVYADGVDYEGSIYYHRLAVEIFLSVYVLGLKRGGEFSPAFRERLEKMLEFVMSYTRPGGSSPRIGDADDGRVQILSGYPDWNRLDHRDLLSTGAAVFGREDFKAAAGRFFEESFWLLGERGAEDFRKLATGPGEASSRGFPDSGFYFMRRGDLHLTADCLTDDPAAPPAHRHNSRLSIELSIAGVDFIVDPGTFVYTASSEERNLFRSTGYHNTVTVDGREQNRLNGSGLFSLRPGGRMRVRSWLPGRHRDYLEAEYLYSRTWPFLRRIGHRRQIYFAGDDCFWLIRDTLEGAGKHRFSSFFHFDSGVRIAEQPDGLSAHRQGKELRLSFIVPPGSGTSVEVDSGWISKRYGIREQAPLVSLRGKFQDRVSIGVVILPGGRAREAVLPKAREIYHQLQRPGEYFKTDSRRG